MDLHVKPSRMLHSKFTKSNDLPPGFENNHYVNTKEKLYRIPQIKWKCPPKFVMSSNWQIAAGEESEEVAVQKLREMRVLEAFYPHALAIPTCPIVSSGIEDDGHDDRLAPVIPIIPVEEEEASEIPSTNIIPIRLLPPASPEAQLTTKEASEITSQAKERTASGMSHGLGLDLITAAALAATLESNEIDTQLLVKIISDPKMVKEYGGAANAGANVTNTTASKVSDPVTGRKQANQPSLPVSAPTIVLKPAAARPVPLTGSKPDMVQPPNESVGHFTNGKQPILSGPMLPDTIPPVNAPTIVLKPAAAQPIHWTGSKLDMFQPPTAKVGHFTNGMQPILPGPIQPSNGMDRPTIGNENSHKAQKQVNVVPNLMPRRVPDPSLETMRGSGCYPVKDVNYYKNLIRQHGRESQESNIPFQDPKNQFHIQKLNTGEFKPKKHNICAYFNSSRGCKNGANCFFKHEMVTQKRGGAVMEPQNTKRMRIGGEIANRT